MLWSLPASGGAPSWLPIVPGESSRRPVISGPENRLVFESWRIESDLWRMSIEASGTLRADRVTATTDRIAAPQLSHRADQLAYYVARGDGYELWTSSVDGSAPRLWPVSPLLQGGAPRWSKEDDSLLFVQLVDGRPQIHLLDLATRQPTVLTDEARGAITPSWSASGAAIYYSADLGDGWRIRRRPLRPGLEQDLVFPVVRGLAPQETADGQSLLFVKPGQIGLWRLHHGEEQATPLPARLAPLDWGNWAIAEGRVFYQHRAQRRLVELDLATLATTASFALAGRLANPGLTAVPDGSAVFGAVEEDPEVDVRLIRALPELPVAGWVPAASGRAGRPGHRSPARPWRPAREGPPSPRSRTRSAGNGARSRPARCPARRGDVGALAPRSGPGPRGARGARSSRS